MVRPDEETRLAGFNRERDEILAEVERQVVTSRVAAAARGGDASLVYVLNDVAFQEIRRLERGPASKKEKRRLGEWRDLARRLGTMGASEAQQRLSDLVHEYALDVRGNFDPRVYRFATGLMPSILSALLAPGAVMRDPASLGDLSSRLVVDGEIEHARACAERGTLVVVPTHLSNMDSVVLGWSLHLAGLPPSTYGAGKNLFSNPFISFFMHNLGAYRVDRRIQNALYKDVLKNYSTVLLCRGYHSLFFPGGTRSRSGAVEKKLKLGLLGTTLAAYEQNLRRGQPDRRIYIVPASINYAVVLEAETLIDDYLAEQGKHRYIIEDDEFSRLGRVVDFARRILAMQGALQIRYGAPLDPFGNAVDEAGESLDGHGRRIDPALYLAGEDGLPRHDPQRDAEYTRGLGDELVHAYRRLTVFMPTHLVARALYDHLSAEEGTRDVYRLLRVYEGTQVPMDRLCAEVARLRDALARSPASGALAERYAALPPVAIVDEAVRMLQGYHTRPVIERIGDRVLLGDLRLLFYYQNRTAHVGAS